MERLEHAIAGPLALEYSSLSIDGLPGLGLVVYTAQTAADAEALARLLATDGRERAP